MLNLNKYTYANFEISSDNIWFILTAGIAIASAFALIKLEKSSKRLNYDTVLACKIAGFLNIWMNVFHNAKDDINIINEGSKIIVAGPHRTSLDGLTVASKIKGTPPQFFVTDQFDAIPGMKSFLAMFKMIPIKAVVTKGENGQSGNASALDEASKVLDNNGCVALFPQGNFAKINQDPPKIYSGAAKLAIKHKLPIQVLRLDGFWSLQNPLIPLVIRNDKYYRAFFSLFHPNKIRTTVCCEIDFHLKPENEHLTDDEKIEEINAQMYAYYRQTNELSVEQIDDIKTIISNKKHHGIWNNKVKQDSLQKSLLKLKEECLQLESEVSSLSFSDQNLLRSKP